MRVQLRSEGLTWHVVGDEVVILDLDGSVYLKLNGTARTLWERLASPATEADLLAALRTQYDVEEDRAATDVAAFVGELRRRQLIAD